MKREYMLDDVIAAISTPIGTGSIGIVRMSGAGCIALADSIFIGKKKLTEKATHTLSYGKITDGAGGEIIDEVLVSVMKAPHTYTKEDIVEINCHGGSLVTRRVLEAVLKTGARIAQPGEFTKRSFLNGRIDLTQAEAVIDLIESKTELSRQAAVNQLPLGSIVVQKKHGTTIYQSGQEQVFELTVGGPYQATGGMGDTLAGMIAAFAGQFKSSSPFERVTAATLLHSLIADELSQEAYVVLPTSISRAIPRWMKEMSR